VGGKRQAKQASQNNTEKQIKPQITRKVSGPNPTPETRKLDTPWILPAFPMSPQAVNAA
jgi:hypothetical protein